MKTILIALSIISFLFISCQQQSNSNVNESDHGHDHSSDTHMHEDGSVHANHGDTSHTQEDFIVDTDSVGGKLGSTHSHGDGQPHSH
ncbi:MAG: hypothetical protein ACU4F9_10500 [Arcticibacter sp.]